ncbi:MAG: protein kinase [Rhodopirellula sp.]|nr:protein kinase [Rhodopirellula sp.]
MNIRHKRLPIETLERIDDLCADFEQKWQANQPVTIESVVALEKSVAERDVLLAELIALDNDYRRRRGETPAIQEYLERFPESPQAVNDAIDDGQKNTSGFEPPTIDRLAELFPALEIIKLVGTGGMAAVYKAKQPGLDRFVALKILPEEFSHDVKFALRFTREARTLAKLSHPNIISVFEFGNIGDTYYFLMEFIDGTTLREIVAGGQLAPEQALSIVPHLCDALQYAHDKRVVHRDIKPENILISSDGVVKIADFGLSRIIGNETHQTKLTGTHQIMGTPRYMAPEQLESSRGVDHRADIYSLGVVFYEMLTGELPMGYFAAPSKKVEIDVRLDEVVLRTLEKEPQRRYQTASQIKSDVQSITSTQNPALEKTLAYHAGSINDQEAIHSRMPEQQLAQQEMASRLLLTRRELLERVARSLRPLFLGQVLQGLVGIALIALGAYCWAPNTHIPYRVTNGVILHVYGVLVLAQSILVCTRIQKIDYTQPLTEIRSSLDSLRSGYLRAGVLIGFVWWLMWIPVAVSLGNDVILLPNSLVPSLVVGMIGFTTSLGLYWLALKPGNPSAESWKQKFSGKSISSAYLALEEIERTQIN